MKRKYVCLKSTLKLSVVGLCLAGFLIQTWMFLLLYWTYPTVVDIQESIPTEIDVPAISFCNSNGLKPWKVCSMKGGLCFAPFLLSLVDVCGSFKELCSAQGSLAGDMTIVTFHKFMREKNMTGEILEEFLKPVTDFFKCKIIRGDKITECGMDIITASFFSSSNFINLCYTINSFWGKPEKKPVKIGKYDRIELDFFVNMTDRIPFENEDIPRPPKYNYPSNAAIQLLVHSPYVMINPYASGQEFLGGKRYQLRLKMEENHLLPPPYQTNCTDYMPNWYKQNGFAPTNPMMIVEECKYRMSLEKLGCVPFSIDYPHNETICRYCSDCKEITDIFDECTNLLDHYNQPCDFINYDVQIEEKHVYVKKTLNLTGEKSEELLFISKGHNCSVQKMWTVRCQRLKIELVFDYFEIRNLTYNPKIESMELFSAIGGYMGLYLGISIVAMYDLLDWSLTGLYDVAKKKRMKKKKKHRTHRAFVSNRVGILPTERNCRVRYNSPRFREAY